MTTRKQFTPDDPRVVACEAAKIAAGGPKVLGPRLGINRQAVEAWKIVPADRVLQVEKESAVSRFDLRPDIFGAPGEGLLFSNPLMAAQHAMGSQALAEALGLSLAEMQMWDRVPPELVLTIERLTGISRHALRADVFGEPAREQAA